MGFTANNTSRRFGVMIYPDKPLDQIIEEAQYVESLGFDQVFLPDHTADLRDPSGFWLETMTTLAIIARETTRIRVGTLVANPIMRTPFMLAKQALTVELASQGRLELGIGAGVFEWDHAAVGTPVWSRVERGERLHEFTGIVDGILRGTGDQFDFEGRWYRATGVQTTPATIQRPRPPLIIGGQSTAILRTAARYGDTWNTIGPMGASADDILTAIARQNWRLDALAVEAGRDPAEIRRSYTTFGAWEPWDLPNPTDAFEQMVRSFSEIGIQDFVTGVPEGQEDAFETVATDVVPRLRELPQRPASATFAMR